MNQPDLRGKTALVTGGGRGIGRATALLLAGCGARVIVTARGREQIDAVAREIEASGGKARAIPGDVSEAEQVKRLFEATGPVDILINNAGTIQPVGPVVDIEPAAWRDSIAINLNGIFYTCHYALPHMLRQGWGRIVNVTSGAARGSTTAWSAYSAGKAGAEALTAVLAKEVGERGVRVNALRPGVVDTQMQVEIRTLPEERFGAENLARYRGFEERGLLRPPEHPARLILWLLTPEADEVNGEIVYIDEPRWAEKAGLVAISR